MSTVDGILASGIYRDRHGRYWEACKVTSCSEPGEWWNYHDMARNGGRHLTVTQMRLLIERDQHREECDSLGNCVNHPVVSITRNFRGTWSVYAAHGCLPMIKLHTFSGAMSAARALTVDP